MQCLNKRGIDVKGDYFNLKGLVSKKEIDNQITMMVNLHKKIMGIKFTGVTRIDSRIGKLIEEYKVQMKILKSDYNKIMAKTSKNDVDNVIISEGKRMLCMAERSLSKIEDKFYYNIISRSMNRKEICIGRCDENNLTIEDNRIKIGSIKNISYNLVEEDLYKYIKRLQKKNVKFDELELIKFFAYKSHLSDNSIKYLEAICIYPRDFLRNWEKYRKGKINKTDNEYICEFKRALKFEFNFNY